MSCFLSRFDAATVRKTVLFVQREEAFQWRGPREMQQPRSVLAITAGGRELSLQLAAHVQFVLGNEGHQHARVKRLLVRDPTDANRVHAARILSNTVIID